MVTVLIRCRHCKGGWLNANKAALYPHEIAEHNSIIKINRHLEKIDLPIEEYKKTHAAKFGKNCHICEGTKI